MSTSAPKFSETISEFCSMVESARLDYQWNCEEIQRLERLTQDYLHMLELEDLDYRGRARLATQLAKVRRDRRASKDTVEVLRPLVNFLDSDKGRNMMNLVREALGKTRKAEEWLQTRSYRYRVLDHPDIETKITAAPE